MDPKDVEAAESENGNPDQWLKPYVLLSRLVIL